MTQYNKQLGFSTTGFLTVSAIYVSLLAYANLYAFNNTSISESVVVPVSEEQVKLSNSTQVPVGEVNTGNEVADVKSDEIKVKEIAEPATPESEIGEAQMIENTDSTTADKEIVALEKNSVETTTAKNDNQDMTAFAQMPVPVANMQYDYNRYDYNRVNQNFNGYNGLNAFTGNQYNQYAMGNSRGNGRSRGNMNSDGEFNFSMKFTSRARMDADSEMNSQLQNAYDYYANQAMYYQNQNQQQNAFNANYQQR